jgi:amino acid transporter
MAAARDKVFPPLFGRVSAKGVPATGMVLSATFATILVLIQAAEGSSFSALYRTIIGLSTMTAVIPYAFCALAVPLVVNRLHPENLIPRLTLVELVAFVFSVFTLYGCGAEPVLYGTVLLILGIPVFVWQRRRAASAS